MLKQTVVAVLLLTTIGQPPAPKPTLDLERIEAELAQMERTSVDNRAQCLTAFGHPAFCDCLTTHLPLAVEFKHYVEVVIVKPTDEKYTALSQEWKDVVDATIAARDRCVATVTP